MYNVLTFLENSSLNYPDKTAVKDNNSEITYKELVINAKRIGTFLSEYDVRRKPVVVYGNKSVRVLTTFFGIVYAGGFYVLIDPSFPKERVMKIFNVLKPSVVITDEDKFDRIRECEYKGTVLDINSVEKDIDEAVLSTIRKNALDTDPLYGIFTSGSTGDPKCVVVCHRSVIDFINVFTETFGITDKDVIGNQAPFDFDVSVKDIYSTLKCGATIQIIPKQLFSFPTKLLDYLDDNNVTTLVWAVSALCIVTTLNGFEYKVPSKINKVIFSGEVMPIKHLNLWRKAYPDAMFVNVYGPTEITCNCTYYIVDREYELDETLPMGKAFPNERVFLLDDDDNIITESQPGTTGEICVSGTAVTMGYYNNPEKTDAAFVQNPLNNKYNEIIYRTGDLGYYNNDGLMCFSSRKDFQIKHMGHRIELGEIDMAINAVDDVVRACCIFHQDANKILGFYEGAADKKTITHVLMQKLPKFMIPQEFIQVESMPITKNGKIDRKLLLENYIGGENA